MSDASSATGEFIHFDALEWEDPSANKGKVPDALVEQASKTGARRKVLVTGQGGFHMNHSELPPGFRIPPHSHEHDEMLVIVAGGCTIEGGPSLTVHDTAVLRAGEEYAIDVGTEGVRFLTIRQAAAGTAFTGS